jgi:hypothetical protein
VRASDYFWLLLAGFGGGITGSVAGLASLVSYPALLAVGIPAVSANMTNTVSLIFSAVGSVHGSRPELRTQPHNLRRFAACALAGGAAGAALLLATPAHAFTLIVPWFIGLGSLGILLRRRAGTGAAADLPRRGVLEISIFLVTLYGGYFGAAAGVVFMAIVLLVTADTLAEATALKNVLLGLSNAVAAVAFLFAGHVRWLAVLPLAAGFLGGGRLGPEIVRRVPAMPLRILIACGGVGLAVHLGLDAYR